MQLALTKCCIMQKQNKALRANIILADHLSVCKKKKKKLSVLFLPLTLNERNMANSPISTKCRGKNYNLCFRSDHCFVKYTYGNYFITK